MNTPTTIEAKSKELVAKMFKCQVPSAMEYDPNGARQRAKNSAIILVDEIIQSWSKYNGMIDADFYPKEIQYWLSVKEQILLL